MPITQHDADSLVFEPAAGDGKITQIMAIVLSLSTAAIGAGISLRSEWWQHLATWGRLVGGLASAGSLAALVYALSYRAVYASGFAMDRASRRMLLVTKSLCRTYREEFDFDQIRQVAVERVAGRHCTWWLLRLKLNDNRGRARITTPIARSLDESQLNSMAASIYEVLGRDPAADRATPGGVGRWILAATKTAIGVVGILIAVAIGFGTLEHWQAPSWPQVAGVVEAVELGKKLRPVGKTSKLTDAIEIVYRYSVDGVEYRGTRFNVRQNWLIPSEVAAVQQHYRQRRTYQVAYNPSDPTRSFLTTDGAHSDIVLPAIIAAISGLSGLAWAAYSLRQAFRRPSA